MTTAKSKPRDSAGAWWRGQITIGNAINLGAIIVACMGFYFNTNATLANHGLALERLDKLLAVHESELRRLEKNESSEREKARTDSLARAEKTADGIAELNKRMAVAETKYDAIRDELVKIGRQLENVTVQKR